MRRSSLQPCLAAGQAQDDQDRPHDMRNCNQVDEKFYVFILIGESRPIKLSRPAPRTASKPVGFNQLP